MTEVTARSYPRTLECGGGAVELSRLHAGDRAALVEFVARLPTTDLLFVPRDINHPKVIDAWMAALQDGRMAGLAARRGGQLVGCTSIYTDPLSWSRHVGELRVLVASSERGRGLGRCLIQECFIQALELGLKKLVAQMTTNQTGAIAVFEDLGFHPEALLRQHVADRDGDLHDLVLLSHDVAAVAARHEAYGVAGA